MRGKALEFLTPVVGDAEGADDEAWLMAASGRAEMLDQSDCLECLAEAHVVSENGVDARGKGGEKPRDAF